MPQAKPTIRILIVDDSPEDRAAVRRMLLTDGAMTYLLEEAASGTLGLSAVRKSRFDCLLLDHRLHDLNGVEFLGELSRLFPDEAMIAVVMLTGQGDENLAVEVLKRGAQDYLVKGRFTSEVLRRTINDAMLRVETRRELDRLHREARELIRQKDEALEQQAATEVRLRHQLDLIETVARTTTEGLCMIDGAGRITFLNPAAEAILGWSRAELLGTFLSEFLTDLDGSAGQAGPTLIEVIGSKTILRDREDFWPRKGGKSIPIAFSSAPILADGVMVGTVLAIRDITEQRRIDQEIDRRAAELVEADRRKDEFLAMLAHELRNPLAPILNAMRIIGLQNGNDPAQERTREMVEQQVRHMSRLIDDLLDMSRISRGTIQLRKEPTNLGTAVERSVESIRHHVDARSQTLEVNLAGDPIWVDADPTRLDQILSNLLTNAAKYTDPNGRIRLSVAREGGAAEIRVVDDGVGITPDFLDRIFDLFAQADRSLDRSQGGLGIGLTLVRDLVERHGGSISARSEGLGMGSEFVVRLPLIDQEIFEPAVDDHREPSINARSLRVLVVDDNVHAAQSLAVVLQLWGHKVAVAHDGTNALDSARVFTPEVVLLDIGLPEMDGYRVARGLRELPTLAQISIIAMTGYAGEDDRRRSLQAGINIHLVKPIDLDFLEQLLGNFDRSAELKGDSFKNSSTTDGSV